MLNWVLVMGQNKKKTISQDELLSLKSFPKKTTHDVSVQVEFASYFSNFLKLPWLKPRGFLGQRNTLFLSQWTFPTLL
jgi:hypothetical protein